MAAVAARWSKKAVLVAGLGAVLAVVGGLSAAKDGGFGKQFGFSYLQGFMFFLSLCLGGLFLSVVHHLFDAACVVVSGHGTATIEGADGSHAFAWGPNSVFTVPLNARYRFEAAQRTRIAVVSDARYVLSLYRSEKFVFENPARFARAVFRNAANGADGLLESNIVPDVGTCALSSGTPSSRTLRIVPPDGILGLDVCEIPAATGSGELRSLPGTHTFVVAGDGHTELWMDGDADVTRVEWRPGVVFAPGLAMVHRHTNSGPTAARLLGIQYGSLRTPMARDKMAAYGREK